MLLICDCHDVNPVGHWALNLTLTDNPHCTWGEPIKLTHTNSAHLAPPASLTATTDLWCPGRGRGDETKCHGVHINFTFPLHFHTYNGTLKDMWGPKFPFTLEDDCLYATLASAVEHLLL